ncbi:hypothetical protein [Polyangium fumosum]|uniref:Uncharacterized protein n=1 Tax=Polyangium fumosum TaxID=889272 RepID=A0A4U1J8L6_9BACT|nr:hypothetical protein [Polyangium fumosum]TKD03567.1 hypothetical protein E8A74_25545 [Polyangium fumosum]
MADEVSAAGKYLLISVPDFATDPVGQPASMVPEDPADKESELIPAGDRRGQTMSSFLRLGAFHEQPEKDPAAKRANELARVALAVSASQGGPFTLPDGTEVVTSNAGVGTYEVTDDDGNVVSTEDRGVFLDDQRVGDPPRGPDDRDNQSRHKADRMEQSKALLTRGGWWDHTDGNRITTTYGDKVEVIRGNYKMVVMSRQDDPEGAGGWDLSGGHVQDLGPASMPGASVRVEFRPGMFGQRGTWHLENTTNNFNQTSDYAGDFYEHWYGNHKECVVGSENPVEWHETLEKPYGNPAIVERTWASKIESYTGSSAKRVPSITEETYADTTSSLTDVAGNISESTYCDAIITSKTGKIDRPVPAMHEETYAVASNSITNIVTSNAMTNVGAQMETTIAGALGSVTVVGAQADITIAGAQEELLISAHHGSLELSLHNTDIFLGTKLTFQIGPEWEYKYPDTKTLKLKGLTTALDNLVTTVKTVHAAIKLTHMALTHQYIGAAIFFGM